MVWWELCLDVPVRYCKHQLGGALTVTYWASFMALSFRNAFTLQNPYPMAREMNMPDALCLVLWLDVP